MGKLSKLDKLTGGSMVMRVNAGLYEASRQFSFAERLANAGQTYSRVWWMLERAPQGKRAAI